MFHVEPNRLTRIGYRIDLGFWSFVNETGLSILGMRKKSSPIFWWFYLRTINSSMNSCFLADGLFDWKGIDNVLVDFFRGYLGWVYLSFTFWEGSLMVWHVDICIWFGWGIMRNMSLNYWSFYFYML